MDKIKNVSVPTKGTHLLYNIMSDYELDEYNKFPSPRRGPIFSTDFLKLIIVNLPFPSPRRGPIFSTILFLTVLGKRY